MNSTAPQAPAQSPEVLALAPVSPDEFDEIDAILDDLRQRYDETPQWEFCEGFMAALICCRRAIPESEYLPVLLAVGEGEEEGDDGEGSFADVAQQERFLEIWTRRWNEVARALNTEIQALDDEAAYQPEVMDVRGAIAALPEEERATMDGEEIPSFGQVWALGFMFVVEAWPEEWAAPRDKEATKWLNAALEAIVAITEDDTEEPTLSVFEESGPPSVSLKRMNEFADAVWAVYDLRELWRNIGPRVEQVHKVATPQGAMTHVLAAVARSTKSVVVPETKIPRGDSHLKSISFPVNLPDWLKWSLVWLLVALSYVAAARAGAALSWFDSYVFVIWPAAGVGLAAFWLLGWRAAPAVFLAAWGDAFVQSASFLIATSVACGNTLASAAAGLGLARFLLVRPLAWSGPWERRAWKSALLPQDARALVALVVACLVAPVLSALSGIGALVYSGVDLSASAPVLLASWWLANVVGMLLVAPFVVMLFCPAVWRQFTFEHLLVWACTTLVSVSLSLYGESLPGGSVSWRFLVLPFAIWAGLRLGVAGVIITTLAVAVPALMGTVAQSGDLLQSAYQSNLIRTQLAVALFFLTGMTLACITQTRQQLTNKLLAQEVRNRTLVDLFATGPVVAVRWAPEFGLPPRFVSSNIEQLLGISHVVFTQDGFRFCDLVQPDDRIRIAQEDAAHIAARAPAYEQRYRVRHQAGHWVHVRDQTQVTYPEGAGVIDKRSYLTDCTAEVNAQQEHAKLLQALDQSPQSVMITDTESKIEYVNAAFSRVTGFSAKEALGVTPRLLASGKTAAEDYAALRLSLFAGLAWEGEFINRRKNLQEFPAHVRISPVRNFMGETTHYLMLMQDISDIKTAQQKLHRLTNFDGLTGLANRGLMQNELGSALADCARTGKPMALMVLNIDRFKFINDAQGHAAGDELLQQLARALLDLQAGIHLVARLGSNEFGLLMGSTLMDASALNHSVLSLSQSLQTCAGRGFWVSGRLLPITLSFGVTSLALQGDETPAMVLDRAQTALHRAKERGGNTLSFFDSAMGAAARQSFALEHELRTGIERGELRVFLQSQVNARGDIVGAEALVRWQHPVRGLLAPGVFIAMAEETDLIVQLEEWVFAEVLTLMARLEAQALSLNISINLSTRHFRQVGFVPWLTGLLQRTGAEPSRLTLEITESIAMVDLQEVVGKMGALSQLGVHFALDDFGTGYSSLSYLKRLPISELKIDKAFVQDAPDHPDDGALVETILSVAKIMHLKVVAEGVETPAQAEFLTSRSDVVLQGYLYGRPTPADDWLAGWKAQKSLSSDQISP